MVRVDPWLSTLRSLAVEVVTLVICQVLVGLPSWRCCASGFLDPLAILVFTLVPLSQVGSVFFLSPRSWTLLSLLWVGLLLAFSAGSLPQADAVGFSLRPVRMAVLAFSRVGPAPSTWVPLLWTWLSGGGFHRVPSPLSSFGMWSPFGVNSVFCHY